jgi:hypothetical protein
MPEYNHAGSFAFFLTSTEYNERYVYVMLLGTDEASVVYDYLEGIPHYDSKESEFSVRCLKDAK